ncbi:MAG: MraY family glycosyltransferase, partial [Actinomycetota bacterium]
MRYATADDLALYGALAGGALCCLAAMKVLMPVGRRLGFVTRPRLFGKSDNAIVFLGGFGIFIAIALLTALLPGAQRPVGFLLAGGGVLLFLGTADDRYASRGGLGVAVRVACEIAVCLSLWMFGFRPFTSGYLWVDAVFTTLFLVAAVNSFNLVDNMDGVAGATAVGALAGLAILFSVTGHPAQVVLAAAVAGSCLGFLPFNIRRPVAYLGNGGSLLLGLAVGLLALELGGRIGGSGGILAALVVAGVPLTDSVTRQLSRWVRGRKIWDISGGTDHISHRLAGAGLPAPAVALAHGLTALTFTSAAAMFIVRGAPGALGLLIAAHIAIGALLVRLSAGPAPVKKGRRGLIIIGLGAAGALAVSAGPALAAGGDLIRTRALLRQGETAARALKPQAAIEYFREAERRARRAASHLDSRLTFSVRLVPVARQTLLQSHTIALGAARMAGAGRMAADAGAAADLHGDLFSNGAVS